MIVLDAGPLIGLDRGDRRVVALLARAHETGAAVRVPATALAQAMRHPARQARLARLLRQPSTSVDALDRVSATAVGKLLAESGTTDIADAHVVLVARATAARTIVTSDPDDLHRLDPQAHLSVV